MKEGVKELHPNAVLHVVVTKEQRERLQGLIEKKKFKDESEAVRRALDVLLEST